MKASLGNMYGETQSVRIAGIPLFIVLPIIGILVPLCISGPQILVGSLVNMLLVFYALRFPTKPYAIMCMMPSMGAIGNGLVLGTLTPFLIYFIPCIWIGNIVFVSTVQKLSHINIFLRVVLGAMLKSTILFLMAYIFIRLQMVPQALLAPMGVAQLVTALVGGFLAMNIYKRI